MKLPIYMDYHATTPLDPRVLDAMLPFYKEAFGNAASRDHIFGWQAEEAVEVARERVAALIGCGPTEIVWTSGGTESNNLAIKGSFEAHRDRGRHVVCAATEHPAVLDCCRWVEQHGGRVTRVPVAQDGVVDGRSVREALEPDTVLISVMLANNEIGAINRVEEIGALARERDIIFHCDAAQAVGKIPVDVDTMRVDLLSISAHKLYGPKGAGALFVRRRQPRVRLIPVLDGGGHERGMRSGTLNTPGIVGLGMACDVARSEMPEESARILSLRERLRRHLQSQLDGVIVNGSLERRLPGNLNVSFAGVRGDALLVELRDVAVSTGAACTSAKPGPSHVLKALGVSDELAEATLRFGLGRFNTEGEVDHVARLVVDKVRFLRQTAPLSGAC